MPRIEETIHLFEHITECYRIGEQQLEVVTEDGRTVRITALHEVRGGFHASYEELVTVRAAELLEHPDYRPLWRGEADIWRRASEYPRANGDTAEACLTAALTWVDDRTKRREAAGGSA